MSSVCECVCACLCESVLMCLYVWLCVCVCVCVDDRVTDDLVQAHFLTDNNGYSREQRACHCTDTDLLLG